MKKILKVIVALVVIVAVAFGIYFIFNNGTNNKIIYSNVYKLNNEMIVDDINIYQRINNTVDEMYTLIENKNYNVPEVKSFLDFYSNALDNYDIVREQIMKSGVFVNNANTGKYYKAMNKAFKNLINIYKQCNSYLLGTHFKITNPDDYNDVYIVNFYNIFKDSLRELNNFYSNAGMAYAHGTKNMFKINNLYKLRVEYYCVLTSNYVSDYIETGADNLAYKTKLLTAKNKIDMDETSTYLNDVKSYDNLILISKHLDLIGLVKSEIEGTANEFINGLNEKQKSNTQLYYNLIVKG